MNVTEAEQFAAKVVAEFRVPPEQRHAVYAAARRLAAVEGRDLDRELAKLLDEHRIHTSLASAIAMVATGIRVERTTQGMSASERSHFLSGLHDVGTCSDAEDTGEVLADAALHAAQSGGG